MGHAFSNYNESIDAVTNYLKTQYIDLGLVTPIQIAQKYCPPTYIHWAERTTASMSQM